MVGFIFSFIFGRFLDKTKMYKKLYLVLSYSSVVFTALMFYTMPKASMGPISVNAMFIGACVIPLLPLCFSFCV